MIENAFRGGKRYWALLGVWVVLIVAALAAYSGQFAQGLLVTGMSRDVTWGLYIAQFTFLGGVAASVVMVVLPYYLHNYKAFGRILILGECLSVCCVLMCMLFIFVDLGQPMRVLNVILHPSPNSLMFWDMAAMSGYLVLNVVIGATTFEAERQGMAAPGWIKPLIYLSIPWAVGMVTVHAFLYSGLAARPFWMTAILGPRFLASAFASGPALLILLALFLRRFTRFDAGKEAVGKLATIIAYAVVLNLFFMLVELFTGLYGGVPHDAETFKYLFVGLQGHAAMVPWTWAAEGLTVGCAVLLLLPGVRRSEGVLAVVCVAVIAAVWIEKGLTMVAAGFIPSPLGRVTDYTPTATEIVITVGVYAVGLLVLTLLYKIVLNVRATLEAA